MTNSKYYVIGTDAPQNDLNWLSALEFAVTEAVSLLVSPGQKAIIEFTVGTILSSSSQFTVDVVKLEIGLSDDGSEIQIGDKLYPVDVVIDATITSAITTGIVVLSGSGLVIGLAISGVTSYVYSKFLDPITEDVLKTLDGKDMVQFFDASGEEKSGLIFPEGIPGSEMDAVRAFVTHPNTAVFGLIGGSIQVDTGLGIDTKYEIYNASSYQTIANDLGITLAEFLATGYNGTTNADNIVTDNIAAFKSIEKVLIYIPVKINGVTESVLVNGIYSSSLNENNLLVGRNIEATLGNALILGGDANAPIVIRKHNADNILDKDDYIKIGTSGSNTITSEDGDDWIISGGGDDKINAGYGTNIIDGGEGSDTVDYSFLEFGSRDIEINLETHTATNGFATSRVRDSLYNIENIIGSKGDDDISGDASNNTFYGNDGYDNLSGGAGDDKLYGNADEDILDGGSGNDNLFGGSGNDALRGGFNNDNLYGNDGDDILDGESGNDILLGGAGYDTYNFSSSFGVDVVNDSDRSGKIVINGNWVTGDASLVDDGSGEGEGEEGGSSTPTNNIHQLSVNGVTYYLKMSSGVLLISQGQDFAGDVVKIQGFVNGQFGIKLEEPEDPEFGADPVTDGWRDTRTTGPYRIDPLTLDLDGDGVELTSLENSNTFFDLDADGLRENVGWISSDDGILVYDSNNSGSVDNINELFGDNEALGTVELVQYDDNADGVIDSNDAIFSKLQVWQDYDQDGISDEGELKSLSDHNVTSINVNPSNLVNLNQEVAGNVVLSKSTYNYTVDGVTHTNGIYNLELAIDQTNSIFEPYVDEWGNVVDYDVNPETLTLPQSRGYGELHAWNVAMSENADFLNKMKEIVDLSAGDFYVSNSSDATSNVDAKIEEFIYMWAGTTNATGSGRGYDEKKLSTLEKFIGETYLDAWGNSVVAASQVEPMNKTWNSLFNFIKERILIQSVFAEEFGAAFYNYTEDKIDYSAVTTADLFYTISEKYEGYKEISDETAFDYLRTITKVMKDFAVGVVDDITSNAVLKANFMSYIGVYVDGYSYYGSIYYQNIDENTYFPQGYYSYYATDGNDVITLSDEDNSINALAGDDTIYGNGGNDYIFTGDGNKYIDGGAGNDNITTGSGNDVIYGGDGNDTINAYNGSDVIYGGSGSDTIYGGRGNDRIYGGDGNDYIYAGGTENNDNDIIEGGKGDDYFGPLYSYSNEGERGSDTYVYSKGDGNDTINEGRYTFYPDNNNNDIILLKGITPNEILFTRSGGSLVINFKDANGNVSTTDSITVVGHLYDYGFRIEQIKFADLDGNVDESLTMNISDPNNLPIPISYFGTNNSEYISGTDFSDIFYGKAGDDTLIGNRGNDIYFYNKGDGKDVVKEYSYTGVDTDITVSYGTDKIRFGSDIALNNLVFYKFGSDLTIKFKDANGNISTTDEITINSQFVDGGNIYRIETLEFTDANGNVVSSFDISLNNYEYIDQSLGTEGNDYITLTAPFSGILETLGGDDVINAAYASNYNIDAGEGNDYVGTGDGNDIVRGGDGNDTIRTNNGNDTIYGGSGDDVIYGGKGADVIYGGDGNDTIYSDDWYEDNGNDVIEGGKGDDYMTVSSPANNANLGSDTYIYSKGDGNDTINEGRYGVYGDTSSDLVLLKGITPDEILFTISDNGYFTINFKDENGNVSATDSIKTFGIEKIKFADLDGNVDETLTMDVSDLNNLPLPISYFATTDGYYDDFGNYYYTYGSDYSDIFYNAAENDLLMGGFGNDIYTYNLGDGKDTVEESWVGDNRNRGSDKVVFGAGITQDNVVFYKAINNLIIKFKDGSGNIISTDQLTINNQFADDHNSYQVEKLEFTDALGNVISTLDITNTNNYTYTDLGVGGTEGNDYVELNSAYSGVIETFGGSDTIYAYGDGDYNVDAGAGNDYIYTSSGNDVINGGSGNDQIGSGAGNDVIDGGDGNDYIYSESGNDIVHAGAGNDVIDAGDGDDVIYGGDGNDEIYAGSGSDHIYGGDGNDIIYSDNSSGDYGNDVIEGGKGDDIFTMGSWPFTINAGNNTYVYNKGDGNDSINEGSAGNDVILLKGISPDEILFVSSNSGFAIKFKDANGNISTSDSIRIPNQLGYSGFRIEKIKFADVNGNVDESLTIDISDPNNLAINVLGTDGNDYDVRGSSFADIFNTGKGNDTISDYGGSDTYIYNIGDGTDMIFETGSGSSFKNDTIKFGAGIAKSDIFFSISDNDVIVNFKNSSDDKIIIRNFLLSTDYKIENVEFSDGKTLDISGINASNLDEYNRSNNAPEVAVPLESKTINQNSSESLISAATIASSFIDVDGDVLTYSATLLDGSALPSWLTINSTTGELRSIAPDNSTVGNHAVIITATDPDGESVSQNFSFAVNNVNDAPTNITLSNSSINENSDGVVIGNLATSDVDAGDSFTYTVNDSRFEIVGNQLKLKSGVSLDYEAASTVVLRVTTTDAGGLSFNKDFTINVNNVNEAPTANNITATILEDNQYSISVASLLSQANAFDVDGDPLTISSVQDANNGSVVLNNGNIIFTPNANYNGATSFTFTVNDGHGLTITKTANLNITAVNDAPTNITLSNSFVNENSAGAVIGDLSALDVDLGDSFTYSIVGNSNFEIVNGNQLKLKSGKSLNYETTKSVNVNVKAVDVSGLSVTKTLTINVNNVNEAPTANNVTATTLEDNQYVISIADLLAQAGAADVDGDALTISSVQGAKKGAVILDATSGNIIFTPTANYYGTGSFTFTVNDGKGLTITKTATLNITSVNDAPIVKTQVTDKSYKAGNPFSLVISTNAFSDVDVGDVLTYSATLADGSALPEWLVFDSITRTFSGNPPSGEVETLAIKLIATDTSLASASQNFNINITSNVINGTDSNNTLRGTSSNDELYGFGGNDTIYGSLGADKIDGGDGIDTARYLESTAAVNVNLLTNVNRGGYAEGDTLFNIEKILGSNFDDILTADNNANTVYGYDGNDVISLEAGDDISYGGNGNDVISGGAGNDTLYGEAGNDILIGGAGKDTLYGGVGSDSFTFTSLDQSVVSSADVIKDFTKGEDLIDLSGLGFSSIISGRSSSNESTLYYYNSGSNTIIEDFNHTFKVTLSGNIVLTDSDFDFS